MNRRAFLRWMAGGAAAVGAAGGSVLLYASGIEPGQIEVVQQTVAIPHLPKAMDGLRAVQVSDLHAGSYLNADRYKHVVDLIIEQKPDVVFVTGDFLSEGGDHERAFAELSGAFSRLTERTPVFSVLGNHDYYDQMDTDLRQLLRELGFHDVTNTVETFQPTPNAQGGLVVAGVGTLSNGEWGFAGVVEMVRELRDQPIILLAHEPDTADWSAEKNLFALQLSGHSHGGQVNAPFAGPMILPWMGEKYPAGLYQVGEMQLYTNRGIGMTRLPVRFNCPPEITVFTFTARV